MKKKIQKYLSGEREGFSLIELIIVIAIMAILIGVVALVVLPYLEDSRESTDRAALNEVATAFKSAASDPKFAGSVPNTFTDIAGLDSKKAGFKAKLEGYLEKDIAATEGALQSTNCKGCHFYFKKDAKGYEVIISKDGSAAAVDGDGDKFTSLGSSK